MTTQVKPRLTRVGGEIWRGMSNGQRFFFRLLLAFIATFGLYNSFGISLMGFAGGPIRRAWNAVAVHFAVPGWFPPLNGIIPGQLRDALPGTAWAAILAALAVGLWLFIMAKLGRATTYTLALAVLLFSALLCYVPGGDMPDFESFSPLLVWLVMLLIYLGIFLYVSRFLWKGLGYFGRVLALSAVLLILVLFIGEGWVSRFGQVVTFLQTALLMGMGFGLYKADLDKYTASTPNVQQLNVGEPEDDPLVSHDHH